MPSWFKKVFKNDAGKPPEPSKAEPAVNQPAPEPQPRPAPMQQPPEPTPMAASTAAIEQDGRPKIRKVVNAPVLADEADQSSWSEEIRIKAQVERDGYTCKFMVDRPVFEGLSAYFPAPEWAEGASPLAERLFQIDGVGTVLIHGTTVTIGRAEGNNRGWKDLATEVGAAIREHLKADKPVVTDEFKNGIPPEEDIRKRIQAVLDLEINPGIAAHSGVVSLERVEGNTVYITMGGGCQGCAASTITLRHGIHTAFRKAVPEVGAIYDETDHAAGENPFFKELPAGMAP